VRGGPGLDGGAPHADRRHVLVVGVRELLRDFGDRHAQPRGGFVDLVVDVGDVAGVYDLRVVQLQQTVQQVEYDRRAGIADMRVVVDRRPAYVHGHAVRVERLEHLFFSRQRVVYANGQVALLSVWV
jgi:hypothetical protein